jgi:hypothetical protein
MPEGIGYSDAAARGAASQPTQRPSSAERGDARPREDQEVRRPSQAQTQGVEVRLSERARGGAEEPQQSDTYADPRDRR